ncbi:unnamed protein product [Chrysodeixis includens]|uniref:Uncharacterized protein n=1 Tax=Chrysodeixis includens TaxID=689277 RepID=A0A9P0BXY8_CHRIL|nr:unnamed protein product [Chrysodeixis includens]
MVYVCNIKTSAVTPRTKSNIDIDDFINKLLSSQKFDELADKVAEKAAKKIKDGNKTLPHVEGLFATNNFSQEGKEKSSYDYKKESANNFANFRASDPPLPKHGKINTVALMRDNGGEQSENLKLKYKYLTKNAPDRTPEDHNSTLDMQKPIQDGDGYKKQDGGKIKARKSSSHDDHSKSNHKSRSDKVPKENLKVSRKDGRLRHTPKSDQDSQKAKPEEIAKSTSSDSSEDDEKDSKSLIEGTSKELGDMDIVRADKDKEESQERKEDWENFEKSKEEIQADQVAEDKPTFKAHDSEAEPNVEANKVALDDQVSEGSDKESVPSTTDKPSVREEGNKVYGFPEGSSYEDYHEQYAKMQKEKENNTPFPMF